MARPRGFLHRILSQNPPPICDPRYPIPTHRTQNPSILDHQRYDDTIQLNQPERKPPLERKNKG